MFIEILKSILYGIVEGITEWLPISSTGHIILLSEFVKFRTGDDFFKVFEVVIQLGAIMAVVVLYFNKLFPINKKSGKVAFDKDILMMWLKILVACIPAGIVGVLFDDFLDEHLYNYIVVAIMLILFGILFIVVEKLNKGKEAKVNSIKEISFTTALLIGFFQLIAAVFPGTSRSGATILGALLIGVSRSVAAEFTFYLAVPAMLGASVLKIIKYGASFTKEETIVLLTAMLVAFVVSLFVIKFLINYIKKHDFKAFGWYRIILGVLVLGYFIIF